jgi:hypothetical protein
MISSQKKEAPMKYLATVALLLTFGVAVVSAEENTVKMTFSGISGPTVVNLLQPNSSDGEDNFAGSSPLGSFTVRNIRVFPNNPPAAPPSSCSSANQIYFTESAGGGIVRFQDGGLLFLNLTQGSDCIDLSTGGAHCILTYQISGGTGRFKHALGTLTMTEDVLPALADATGNPVIYGVTGEYTGTISGVDLDEEGQAERQ